MVVYTKKYIEKLNQDIQNYSEVTPIDSQMTLTFEGISRLIMLDRYTYKDPHNQTLVVGDLVVLTVHADPQYPARGIGTVEEQTKEQLIIKVEEEFRSALIDPLEVASGRVIRNKNEVEKPLELYFEQIASRVASGISAIEGSRKDEFFADFYKQLTEQNLIPAGRVLYGAGTHTEVTYFNCFVMPFIQDSRSGLATHRQEVMEIMSRGGGVGTNGSTLRPKSAIVHGVKGKSSGAVSWLNDLANLTHLVEQGGSRRGAQMIMLNDWHPDIFEFIISKIQNPMILQHLIATSQNPLIQQLAREKLSFSPLTQEEKELYEVLEKNETLLQFKEHELVKKIKQKLRVGGTYSVKDPDFLTGANISVCLTKEFMEAIDQNGPYELRFPAVEDYSKEEMADYDQNWAKIGDVREWEATGRRVKVYQTIQARELWELITYCATYSAEPGIFFIDNANEMTNATAYGQKVVATNPCGEQPLTPYAVCNLAAINLAKMVDKTNQTIDFQKVAEVVKTSVRFQDNVIDATPYFFDKNEQQAKGERRIGLGVMVLADLLIYCKKTYGSKEGNELVDQLFETIATTAYQTSIELAKEKGSFPFLVGETEEETKQLRQRFIDSGYMKKMPEKIRQGVLAHGIRNSHLLTVAPTGSTGTMTGVSTGLEPYFSFSYFRSGRLGKFIEVHAEIVDDYLSKYPEGDVSQLPEYFVSAMELSPEAHVDVQCTIQRWVDSSISKTVNAPKGSSVTEVAKIYEKLYAGKAKGGTVYVDGSRDSQVLTLSAEENTFPNEAVKTESLFETGENIQNQLMSNQKVEQEGERCPICHEGMIEEIGGCSTCTHCKVQLKCGL
ncbi:MAG: vitamin B12-dependent ribonucleotide reductase [Enterococcus lacertideformus]|uniref:Vitamin B12-dependent ribonucleotide reductase n=1 Tax=Enterococcus lacertideformus TaxID=2771493 RepID=A0A931FB06_9ENTE|nr:vitamin B12-dependent ribonucleotide reductase [Enterococcus lacertideformus]